MKEKKIRDLKDGDQIEIVYPDGTVKTAIITYAKALRKAKTVTFGGHYTISADTVVKVLGNKGLNPGVAEAAKKQFEKEKKEKEG